MKQSKFFAVAAFAVLLLACISVGEVLPSAAAPTDSNSSPGTISGLQLNYVSPAANTVTMSFVGPGDTSYGGQSMNSSGFWGGNTPASINNMSTAYTPNSIKDVNGISFGWWNQDFPGFAANWPSTSNAVTRLDDAVQVTFTFARPVNNAVFQINNLGGKFQQTGFDYAMFSDWTITSGQPLQILSGPATTNVMLDGNTIRNKNVPQSLESKVATGSGPFPDFANGTGSASVVVSGTYTQVTFSVGISLAVVNYASGTPSNCGNFCIGEYVAMQWSVYTTPPPVASPSEVTLPKGGDATFPSIFDLSSPSQGGAQLDRSTPCIIDPASGSCGSVVVIPGQGTFTLDVASGIVTFQSEPNAPDGTLTAVRYRVSDISGQSAESTLTPRVDSSLIPVFTG